MNWIKTKARFRDEGISDEAWDCYSDQQKDENSHLAEFRFDAEQVQCYNASSNGKDTTIWFRNNQSAMVVLSLAQLDSIFEKMVKEQ